MGQRCKPNREQAPAVDRGNDVALRFKRGKVKSADLYDELTQSAGLSPEEAAEMADLLENEP